jgi:hypothetical protein
MEFYYFLVLEVFRRLYEGQVGNVVATKESKEFSITRGTKQGDPVSPQLFNSLLERAIASIKDRWVKNGWGIKVGPSREDHLTNLRFADDLLLVSRSLTVLQKMLQELRQAVGDVGLELHLGKTKILTNAQGRKQSHAKFARVGDNQIEILAPSEPTKYLGRALAFMDFHDREIKHRISAGWAKFTSYKKELCDRGIPLERRLRLFNSVVTPTVMYGSGSWTMTREREQRMRVARRRMIRKIVQVPRAKDEDGTLEDWVSYFRRSTHEADKMSNAAGVTDWEVEQRRRKWRWAGHVARMTDRRWTWVLLMWVPTGARRVGKPKVDGRTL